uniref:Forkhead box M1 n=1 Tax=Sparus aurata TaxID=8175 RepID=A0A671WXU8_SPAAU
MRRRPRRPLILRRKLPFQQNDPPAAGLKSQPVAPGCKEPPKPSASQSFLNGIHILDHPSMSDKQVVVIPKTADLQSVIGALTAKGKECGVQGPNKFILLSGSGGTDGGSFSLTGIKTLNKDLDCGPLDDSLTNIQWLGTMSTCALESDPNSIRHNLSLHNMFLREASPDGKIYFWTIRPEANRCLTLDQVYKPGCDPMTAPVLVPMLLHSNQQQKRMHPDPRKTQTGSERRMKPLLPRTELYLVPIQLPVASSVYLPSLSAQFTACAPQKPNTSRGAKGVRIAPKVTQSEVPTVVMYPQKSPNVKTEVKEEPARVPIKCPTPKSLPQRQASSSRRKQRLVHSAHEEPVLLCPDNTFFDSGVASDVSTFQDMQDTEMDDHKQEQHSPDLEFSFKTRIKGSSHLTSSTPSKPPTKVTPVGKGSHDPVDFSPIRTPGGPAVTPRHDYTTFSFNSTPFKDWPLFSSPRELLTSVPSSAAGPSDSPMDNFRSSCSRELLQAGGATPANRSITEGLVLDMMNDSLSEILVDISFSGLDDKDMANISWSEFIPHFK